MEYKSFINSKKQQIVYSGFDVDISELNSNLFEWQKYIVKWALKKGKANLFEDCGLGKSIQQLSWAEQVYKKTNKNVLILAPLAVSEQTKREGVKFEIAVNIAKNQSEIQDGINITNYERLNDFDCSSFGGVVLDESSILKNSSGKVRTQIINEFKNTPYKLACTATPAPNDFMELGNHSEFLGIMSQTEMLATFFVHDGGDTSKWRLKGHAKDKFWAWLASFSCVLQTPADLGFDGKGYELPELIVKEHIVDTNNLINSDGQTLLFSETVQTLQERQCARRESIDERVKVAAEIANNIDGQVLIWCGLNSESELLKKSVNNSVEVKGSDKPEHKTKAMIDFSNNDVKCLISKPSICGFGMNWQNCNTMIFVGLSDSFEAYYQAVRRCWRFGQDKPVTVHIITSDAEGAVKSNIERKQKDAQKMQKELVKHTKEILSAEINGTVRMTENYITKERIVMPQWIA